MAQELPLALPRYVTLKSKHNNKYMRCTDEDGEHHGVLQLTAESAAGSPYTKFEVEPSKTAEGLVHLRCAHTNKYWARTAENQKWIAGTAAEPEEDQSKWSCTLFKPVPVDHQQSKNPLLVRFLHVQLDNYASMSRSSNFVHVAGFQKTRDPAQDMTDVFEVEERALVVSRSIYNVNFRLQDARIYNQSAITLASSQLNNTSPQPATAMLRLAYVDARTSTWDSRSPKHGVPTTLESGIPLITGEGTIEISPGEMSGPYAWGETLESSHQVEAQYHVMVGPNSRVTVSMLANRATCEVPFSYTQMDTFFGGTVATYELTDGVYTGVNLFNVRSEIKEEKL